MGGVYELDASTVDSRLVRWGRWKMRSGVALGYPSRAAFMRMAPSGGSHDQCDEFDHECVETNNVVELLPFIQQIVLRVEYALACDSVSVKAYKCGVCKRSYHNYLIDAKKMFANIFNQRLHVVHDFDINVVMTSELRQATS